jgi:hypothetical protein
MINAMMEDQQLQALFKMEQQICSELWVRQSDILFS